MLFSVRSTGSRRSHRRGRGICVQDLSAAFQRQIQELNLSAPPKTQLKTTDGEVIKLKRGGKRRGKYNVAPPEQRTCDGILFDSKLEMQAYQRFKQAFGPDGFKRQVTYTLLETKNPDTGRKETIRYIADFEFKVGGRVLTVDIKGVQTAQFKLKLKLFHEHTGRNLILLETLAEVSLFIDELRDAAA